MDVTFLETEYFFQEPGSHSSLQGEMISEEQNIDHGYNHGYNWENQPWFRDTNTRVGQNNGTENEQEQEQEQLTDTVGGTNTRVGQNNETENEQEQEQPTNTEDGRVGQNSETENEQE